MQCDFAFICDYAEEAGGKLHAVGIGWDTIYAPNIPATHPMLGFVARLRGSAAEAGTKDVTIRLLDADGSDAFPAQQHQVPFQLKPNSLLGNLNIVMQLGGLEFKKYGAYAIHLVVQGNEMASVSFNVSQPPTTA